MVDYGGLLVRKNSIYYCRKCGTPLYYAAKDLYEGDSVQRDDLIAINGKSLEGEVSVSQDCLHCGIPNNLTVIEQYEYGISFMR